MSLKKWFPSPYLAADDVTENEVVTMQKICDEKVGSLQEIKPVLYFYEYQKGLILNKTNAREIARLYGDSDAYRDWPENKLAFFTENVRNPQSGEIAPAIRVKAPPKTKKGAPPKAGDAAGDEIPY